MILQRYADIHPEQILFISGDSPSGSAKANFLGMLHLAKDSNYAMFSDQDDVWFPDKTTILMDKMREAEDMYGSEVPLLVYSDMQVVNADCRLITGSFMRYQGYNGEFATLNRLLARNCVTGCAMLWNRALTSAALSMTYDAVTIAKIRMHDYWLALIAASLGKIAYVDKPTVMYRQHSSNSIGALGKNNIFKRLRRETGIRERIRRGYVQAQLLSDVFGSRMPERNTTCIDTFLNIPSSNIIWRTFMILKGRYLRESSFQAVAYFFALILLSSKSSD
jgi:hypothetical protein